MSADCFNLWGLRPWTLQGNFCPQNPWVSYSPQMKIPGPALLTFRIDNNALRPRRFRRPSLRRPEQLLSVLCQVLIFAGCVLLLPAARCAFLRGSDVDRRWFRFTAITFSWRRINTCYTGKMQKRSDDGKSAWWWSIANLDNGRRYTLNRGYRPTVHPLSSFNPTQPAVLSIDGPTINS